MSLEEKIAREIGTTPEMVRFYAARMGIEISIGRTLTKPEQMRVYNAVKARSAKL